MRKKLHISIVSYTNTLPFRIGIETSPVFQQYADITYDIPAVCARKLIEGEADIGLVPVAALPELKDYHILSDYCIGADGKVDTVKLYGQVPVEEMQTIVLDYQSRTSVKLIQMLTEKYWQMKPQFITGKAGFEHTSIRDQQGAIVIGDRTFELNGQFAFQYDLAEVWKQYTGLPFVFAVWVSKNRVDKEIEEVFNKSLANGINRIDRIARQYQDIVPKDVNLENYLKDRLDYNLDPPKRAAMKIFLDYLKLDNS